MTRRFSVMAEAQAGPVHDEGVLRALRIAQLRADFVATGNKAYAKAVCVLAGETLAGRKARRPGRKELSADDGLMQKANALLSAGVYQSIWASDRAVCREQFGRDYDAADAALARITKKRARTKKVPE